MPEVLAALLIGAVAGLAIAMPLGAIGVLLMRTGLTTGWRTACVAAVGVASVDLVYSAVAVLAGSAVSGALSGHERPLRLAGAVALAAIAARGLWRVWSQRRGGIASSDAALAVPTRLWAVWGRFVALTMLNPATVIYFAVVAAGFATRWQGAAERLAFVVGVGLASAAWQLGLAALGSVAGSRTGPRARLALGVGGDLVVLGLAAALALV
ncbi:MAG TPA: LysE family transporter [Actinotalea sp.]|nr:LysE family transporter [Actinotalea sp.]